MGGKAQAAEGGRSAKLEIAPIAWRILDGYRYEWRLLLGAGLLVFVPVGLFTSLDPFDGNTIDRWEGSSTVLMLILLTAQATVSLLGAVFYSGVVAAGDEERQAGAKHVVRHVATHLPYRALLVADLGLIVVVALGFVALIVPGFIFLVWFALIAPVIEIERTGARAGFRRSREMVRPHFWRVAGLMIPLSILQSSLEEVGDGLGHGLLGETYIGNLLGSTAANLLGSPLYALTVLALYFEILRREKPGKA